MNAAMHVAARAVLSIMLAGAAGLMGYLIAFVVIHSVSFPSAAWLRLAQVVCVGAAGGSVGALAWTPDDESRSQQLSRLAISGVSAMIGGYMAVEATVENDDAAAQGIRWLLLGSILGTNFAGILLWLSWLRSGRVQVIG